MFFCCVCVEFRCCYFAFVPIKSDYMVSSVVCLALLCRGGSCAWVQLGAIIKYISKLAQSIFLVLCALPAEALEVFKIWSRVNVGVVDIFHRVYTIVAQLIIFFTQKSFSEKGITLALLSAQLFVPTQKFSKMFLGFSLLPVIYFRCLLRLLVHPC